MVSNAPNFTVLISDWLPSDSALKGTDASEDGKLANSFISGVIGGGSSSS